MTGDSLEIVDLRDAEESVEGPYVWSEMEDEVVVLGVADAFTCSVLADEAMCTAVFEGVGLPDFTIDQTWSRMP